MDRSELLPIIEQAARYGWDHPNWDWPSVAGDLARFLPPPPAEQASGDDFAYGVAFIARNKNALLALTAGPSERHVVEQTIAALSQRPVVDEAMVDRGVEAAVRQSIADMGGDPDAVDWRADLSPTEMADFRANTRAIIEAALAPQQPEKGEG